MGSRVHRRRVRAEHACCSALQSLKYAGNLFGCRALSTLAEGGLASKLAKDYKENRHGVVSRAPAFEVEFVSWLEHMVVNGADYNMSEQDRLTLGRLRICIGASLRHDDLKRTATSTCSFLMENESVVIRGLIGCAVRTKTKPRHWVCSGHSVSGPSELSSQGVGGSKPQSSFSGQARRGVGSR